MTPAEIINEAMADGVYLALSLAGTIKATGEGAAVNRWLPLIREHKPGILAVLYEAEPLSSDEESDAGVIADLRTLAGTDWPEIEASPVLMDTFARAVQVRRMRDRCKVPEHYTAMTLCSGCGPVPIFPGAPELVDACPWCFNRIAGRSIPIG